MSIDHLNVEVNRLFPVRFTSSDQWGGDFYILHHPPPAPTHGRSRGGVLSPSAMNNSGRYNSSERPSLTTHLILPLEVG